MTDIDRALSAPTTLVIRRTFAATRERVFDAWTHADQIAAWFGPGGERPSEAELDLRVGGAYRFTIHRPGGEDFVAKGVFREIQKPERLAYTWAWEEDDPAEEHETLVTVEFADGGATTDVTFTHARLRDDVSRDRHGEGWNEALDALARHLTPTTARA